MPSQRGQSAIEFITSYSYVILIVTVVLGVLILYFNLPRTIIPFQCNFYSGFTCTDAALVIKPTNTVLASLVIVGQDDTTGVINVTTFNAVVGFHNSTFGFCTPNPVTRGQLVYCVANFSFTPNLTNVYFGTFKMKANYCTTGESSTTLPSISCPASSNFIYAGSVRVQPSPASNVPLNAIINASPFTSWYAQINIVNPEPIGTEAPFQEEILFNALTYSKYEANDLGNIRFYYNTQQLDSWCEINCEWNAIPYYNTIFWVKIPFPLPAYSNTPIEMAFLANTAKYDGMYAGEAPNQSVTYGRYDNGREVFDFYDNFAGNTLNASEWSGNSMLVGGATMTVSNGITFTTTTAGTNSFIYANYTGFSSAQGQSLDQFVVDAALNVCGSSGKYIRDRTRMTQTGWGSAFGDFGYFSQNTGPKPQYYFDGFWTGTGVPACVAGKYNILDQQAILPNGYFTWSSYSFPANPATGAYTLVYSNSITTIPGPIKLRYGTNVDPGGVATSEMQMMFVRIRTYPPAGIMPTAAFGPNAIRQT